MKEHRWTLILVIVVVVLLLLYSAAFTVNEREDIAIVKTFGRASPAIYGSEKAGLHWKWPWPIQSLVRYEARTILFEDTFDEVATKDKQNLLVTVFCGWRIRDANRFLASIETVPAAEEGLRQMIRHAKARVVGAHLMSDFVNTDPQRMLIPEIEKEISAGLADEAARTYGVEIVTLGIKSLGLPKDVTEKVIENMKTERNREAEVYRGRGQAIAKAIRERAQMAASQILEFARNKAENIRARGKAAAAEYYASFKDNEEFAIFLRNMDFLKETLKNNSMFLLDATVFGKMGFPSLPGMEAPTTRPAGSASR
jgi:membrane protease subunit HflC